MAGAKGKFEYWLTEDGLLLLRKWKRDGLTDEQIAHKCDIRRETLYAWKRQHPHISNALTRGREIVDTEVENSLLKKCHGYTVDLKKTFKVKRVEFDPDTGRKISEYEELVVGYDQAHIPADTPAQKFWLINRAKDKWREKQEPENTEINEQLERVDELLGGVDSAI